MPFVWESWNATDDAERVVLIRLEKYNPDISAVDAIGIGSEFYRDTINSFTYRDALVEIPTLQDGYTNIDEGPAASTIGNVIISSVDDFYDKFFDHIFAGYSLTVYVGPRGHLFSDFNAVFTGITDFVTWESGHRMNVQCRDKIALFEAAAQQDKYSDTFATTSSRGQTKPLLFGTQYSIQGALVDDTLYRYEVNQSFTTTPATNARVNGAILAGVTVNTGSAYYQLAGDPGGQVTVNAVHSESDIGDILTTLLSRVAESGFQFLPSAEIDAASMTQLNTDSDLDQGIYINDERPMRDVLQELMPYGYLYGFDRLGLFFAKHLVAPDTQTAEHELGDNDILKNGIDVLEIQQPHWEVQVDYAKNWVQISTFNSGVSAQATQNLLRAYRLRSIRRDTTILDDNPRSQVKKIRLTASGGVSGGEGDRLFDLYSARRVLYGIRSWAKPLGYTVGDVVNVTNPKYGFSSGKNLIYLGRDSTLNESKCYSYFWGS